jgi:A/G-specific adenine glycosylase
MELGATICTPRAPRCGRCPVAARCAARVAGAAAEIPPPRRRPVRRALVLACAILRRNGLLLLSRRPAGGLCGGLWAPPSAEVAPGEDAGAVLARALEREHRVRCAAIVEVATCERILTHRTLTLRAFHVEPARSVRERHDLRWAAEASLHGRSLPSAVRSLLARLGGAPARAAG